MLAFFSIRDTKLRKEILGNIFCVYECMCMYLQGSQIEIVVFFALQKLAPEDLS